MISPLDQVSRTYTRSAKRTGYEETGNEEKTTTEGSWADMCRMADAAMASAGTSHNVTATVTRKEAGLASLEIRKSEIRKTGEDEEEAGDTPGSEGKPGESRDNPQYTMRETMEPEPLLTHPRYSQISQDPMEALKCLINGGTRYSKLWVDPAEYGKPQEYVYKILMAHIDEENLEEAWAKIARGTVSYLNCTTVLECRYRVKSLENFRYRTQGVIAVPPGPFPKPPGSYNWLLTGISTEHSGRIIWISETYCLSGPLGWDEQLYTAGGGSGSGGDNQSEFPDETNQQEPEETDPFENPSI